MTIALPGRSVRARGTYRVGAFRDRSPYEPDVPYSVIWDSIDLKSHSPAVAVAKPMTAVEIENLVAEVQPVDVTPSDNDTTYIEWETKEGFASLEVGYTRFAFTFLPSSASDQQRYGQTGTLAERSTIIALIHKHS